MKKILTLFLIMMICISSLSTIAFTANDEITVIVNGKVIEFEQLPIIEEGRTLVPIRAVCEALGAEVLWDAARETAVITKDRIMLTLTIGTNILDVYTDTKYEEIPTKHNPNVFYIRLDVPPKIYNGYTLLPIRAVVENLGCEANWIQETRTIMIEYYDSPTVTLSNIHTTEQVTVSNSAFVSRVQQFSYKNEGLAYAYIDTESLEITTPNKQLSLEIKYPKLGDVISDDDGNFYIVWGKDGTENTEETIFISKYSPEGIHVKTTGFKGESLMGEDGNTKVPFRSGNCASAIGDGQLMVNYARSMYNGHQSNNVIGVNISDMSPVKFDSIWNIPYTSHSFNQDLIWSKKSSQFIYADHGDAYQRGFVVTSDAGEKCIFTFYLEANANYNMSIVNKTFAQLGGLVETSKGIALVGASAKSIGEEAKEEKQNLFVQIFDPDAKEISPSMFVGGIARSGATSYDINDNENKPLTPITDYGVQWLTNYTDKNVVVPQVVSAGDRIVILWSAIDSSATDFTSNYMVLSADGNVIIPATVIDAPLNSHENPVYHDGSVYWASANERKLRVRSLKID